MNSMFTIAFLGFLSVHIDRLSSQFVLPSICNLATSLNSLTASGNLQTTATTLNTCQQLCFNNLQTTCTLGFDFDTVTTSSKNCYFSTTTTLFPAVGVNHYTISCTLPETKPPTVAATSTSNPSGCTWIPTPNSNSPGGINQPTILDLQTCQSTCLSSSQSNCQFGIDFNPNAPAGGQCWFSQSSAMSIFQGVTHYNYTCTTTGSTCTPTANTNSPGGVVQSSITSQAACQSACIAALATTCLFGFDWNPSSIAGQQCWFSMSATTATVTGITHYTCNTPSTGATTQAGSSCTSFQNKNSPGGVAQAGISTRSACQSACLYALTTTCSFGFDWNPNGGAGSQCWFSTTANTGTATGITHYTCLVPTTTIQTGQTCTSNENTNSPGGVPQAGISTQAACLFACIGAISSTCKFGFDYNPAGAPGQQCWFATSMITVTNQGVTHFTCSPTTTTEPPPIITCTLVANKNSPGGVAKAGITTQADCDSACIAAFSSTCSFGYDFNPSGVSGQQCWFSTNALIVPNQGISHYNCSATSPTDAPVITCSPAKDTNSPGGVAQAGISTQTACQSACINAQTTTCKFGYDYNPSGATGQNCWFAANNLTVSNNGITHYTCGVGTTIAPSVVTCSPKKDMNSPGGTAQAGISTRAACQSACISNITNTCKYGFDYNPTGAPGSQCWFSAKLITISNPGITHYSCSVATTEAPISATTPGITCSEEKDKNSPGGIVQADIATLNDCQAECLSSLTCTFGYDFNPTAAPSFRCWFSTSETLVSNKGINHYTCIIPSPTTFNGPTCTSQMDTNSPGGNAIAGITSPLACQTHCINNQTSCNFGFDFNPNGEPNKQCWISTIADIASNLGITHYTCSFPLTPTKAEPNSILLGQCIRQNNSNTNGGIAQTAITDEKGCYDACLSAISTNCKFGFDFNTNGGTGQKCFFSISPNIGSILGINHFNCFSATCTLMTNSISEGGIIQDGITKLDVCRSECANALTTSCKLGFDFDPTVPNTPRCYFSTKRTTSTLRAATHYDCIANQ